MKPKRVSETDFDAREGVTSAVFSQSKNFSDVVDNCAHQETACALRHALMCREDVVRGGLDGKDRLVVDVMAQLQRSPSPPAVGRNAKLHRIVQPPRRTRT